MGEEAPPVACTTTTDILNPAIYGGAQCIAKARLACKVYVTVAEKTNHSAHVSDIKILVPRCSALHSMRRCSQNCDSVPYTMSAHVVT